MSTSKIVLKILSICVSVLIVVLVVFGLLKAGTAAYEVGYRVFTEQPMTQSPGSDVVVEVSSGMSAFDIGTVLEEKGLVKDGYLFAIQMKLSAYSNTVRPGLYTLNTAQTAKEMLQVMSPGDETEEGDTAE